MHGKMLVWSKTRKNVLKPNFVQGSTFTKNRNRMYNMVGKTMQNHHFQHVFTHLENLCSSCLFSTIFGKISIYSEMSKKRQILENDYTFSFPLNYIGFVSFQNSLKLYWKNGEKEHMMSATKYFSVADLGDRGRNALRAHRLSYILKLNRANEQ